MCSALDMKVQWEVVESPVLSGQEPAIIQVTTYCEFSEDAKTGDIYGFPISFHHKCFTTENDNPNSARPAFTSWNTNQNVAQESKTDWVGVVPK